VADVGSCVSDVLMSRAQYGAHLLFFVPSYCCGELEYQFAQLPITLLQDLMGCCYAFRVALHVHKLIWIAAAAPAAAARRQPR
jgi:hypothetical protein